MNRTAARLIRWIGQHKPEDITESTFRAGVAEFAKSQETKVRYRLPLCES